MSSPADRRYDQIGIDRLVRLKWLEQTAYLVLAGNKDSALETVLQEELKSSFRSTIIGRRGSLDKTITILMKIWFRVPDNLCSLRNDGLKLLSNLPREDHIAVHWGMAMAAYPFWGVVAAHVGRLLRLQGTVAAGQVQRRMRERYGERETVSRRVRYVLRSFVDWGVLKETSKRGIYACGVSRDVVNIELIAWLAEAFLLAHPNRPVLLKAVIDSPSLFPFRFSHVSADQLIAASERLDVLRQALDQDMIMLRDGGRE
jgi:hypothetical protein